MVRKQSHQTGGLGENSYPVSTLTWHISIPHRTKLASALHCISPSLLQHQTLRGLCCGRAAKREKSKVSPVARTTRVSELRPHLTGKRLLSP